MSTSSPSSTDALDVFPAHFHPLLSEGLAYWRE
jgi:hypothetical protein